MFVQLCRPPFLFLHRPHLALEYSGKVCGPSIAIISSAIAPKSDDAFTFQATKIHQRTFGNDHPITARSLELMATVYAEIGKTEYSGKKSHGAAGISPCWENNAGLSSVTVSVNPERVHPEEWVFTRNDKRVCVFKGRHGEEALKLFSSLKTMLRHSNVTLSLLTHSCQTEEGFYVEQKHQQRMNALSWTALPILHSSSFLIMEYSDCCDVFMCAV